MNRNRTALLALAGAAALASPTLASAAELGFYIGGIYGQNSGGAALLDDLTLALYRDLDYTPDVRSGRTDENKTVWGFFGGYRLFQNLAFEGGYMNISKDVLRETSSGTFDDTTNGPEPETWSTSIGVQSKGFAISALGVLPVTYNLELYARGGVLFGSNTLSLYAINQTGFGGADQVTESSTDFLAGVGVSYTLAEVYALRAEFQRIFDAGAKEYGEADVDLMTVGITVKF